eukprot:g29284.t1
MTLRVAHYLRRIGNWGGTVAQWLAPRTPVRFQPQATVCVEFMRGFPPKDVREELDIRTLQNKNRKLAEVIDQRQTIEDELREQIEKLVKRQATDDATLLILNRYWCQ